MSGDVLASVCYQGSNKIERGIAYGMKSSF